MRLSIFFVLIMVACSANAVRGQLPSGWKAHDLNRPAPRIVAPAKSLGGPPDDAVILFDGSDLSKWVDAQGNEAKWKVVDGAMESVPNSGYIYTREKFGDCQLHVEFASPQRVHGNGQGRGNSGVFLMGQFEVQVLDSSNNPTYADGSAGSIYGQYPPLVNVSRKPGQWQTYDIIFHRPRFDAQGELLTAARLTVLHNGVLIQDNSEAYGPTVWIQHRKYSLLPDKLPLSLQDHGNPVRYRNIWIRPLTTTRGKPDEPYDPHKIKLDEETAKKLVGNYGDFPVKFEHDKLYLYFYDNPLEMVAHSKTEFGFVKSAGHVIFEVDKNGVGISHTLTLDAAGKKQSRNKDY